MLRGNRIINISSIVSLVSMVSHCPQHPLSISEEPGTVRGLVSRICVKCTCGWFYYLTDSYDSSQLAQNTQSVLAMRLIGKGEMSLHTFCAMMDLPLGVYRKAFDNYVMTASNDAVRADLLASSEELHAMSAEGTRFVPPPVLESDVDEGDVDEGSRSESESGDDQSSVSLGDSNEEGSDDSDDDDESDSVSDADSDLMGVNTSSSLDH